MLLEVLRNRQCQSNQKFKLRAVTGIRQMRKRRRRFGCHSQTHTICWLLDVQRPPCLFTCYACWFALFWKKFHLQKNIKKPIKEPNKVFWVEPCGRTNKAMAAVLHFLRPSIFDEVKGGMNSTANWVIRHLLGYNCNLYTGFDDQLKALNGLEIWNDLHN